MNQKIANKAAMLVQDAYPGAKKLFVTTDESVFITAEEAVQRAVLLSAGNPEVFVVDLKGEKEAEKSGESEPLLIEETIPTIEIPEGSKLKLPK